MESASPVQSLDLSRRDAHANPLWWAIAGAVVVALLVWGAGETGSLKFKPAIDVVPTAAGNLSVPSSRTRTEAEIKEVRVRTALLGGLIGLVAGLAGGAARRNRRTAILGAAVGLIVGAGLAAAPVWPLLTAYAHAEDAGPGELTRAILMHLGLWIPVGAATGLGLALGLGSPRRIPVAVVGGAIGVAVATAVYEILGSIAFPLAETNRPLALEWLPRLLSVLLVALGAVCGAVAFAGATAAAKPAAAAQELG